MNPLMWGLHVGIFNTALHQFRALAAQLSEDSPACVACMTLAVFSSEPLSVTLCPGAIARGPAEAVPEGDTARVLCTASRRVPRLGARAERLVPWTPLPAAGMAAALPRGGSTEQ